MAPSRRTQEHKDEVAAFLKRLYDLSGAESVTEFAGRAGLFGSNVGEYLRGQTMPDGYTVIRLMASVDARLTARGEAVDLPEPAAPRVRPEDIQGAVEDLVGWQPTVAAELDELRSRLERLETARGSRRKRSDQAKAGSGG